MKWTGILLVAVACAFSARADETNVSATARNQPSATDQSFANNPTPADLSNAAVNTTNKPSRPLSLNDCIELALKHNFTIQIARFNPNLARYTLWGSYGVYDPTLNASVTHDYSLSPGGIDAQGRSFSGVESDTDNIRSGLSGMLPWGLNYNLGVQASDQTGNRPATLVNTNVVVGFSTNHLFDTNLNPVTFLSPVFATRPGRTPFEQTSAQAAALSLSQPLLKNFWIDADRTTIFINKKEVQKSEADFRDTLMTAVTAVETAYFRLIQANENVLNQQKAVELADQTVAENKKKVEVGAMAPLDEQQAEAQAASSQAALLKAISDAGTAQRLVKSLLSDNYSNEWLNVSIDPTDRLTAIPQHFDLQESWRKGLALGGSPQRLQQLRITLAEEEANVRLNKNQVFPELDITGSYGLSGTGKEFSDAFGQIQSRTSPFWSIGGVLTVPLSRTTARNSLKSAKAIRDQQKMTIKFQEQNTLITIENDIATARSGYETVQATYQARLYAEAALSAEQKKYENGKSTLFDILGLQTKLTQARSDEISALADYNVDLANLAFDEGSTFERHHLDLKMQ